MFIFHEGLPGSGKSYESIVHQVIPALKAGRKVFARVNGLDHQKIATLLERPIEYIREHLIQIDEEQMHEVYKHVKKDSLVILDEMQNFWGNSKGAVSTEMTKWITEHRHLGIDIIGMGQSIADVNVIWRRRCQQKIQFLKMDMFGKPKKYKWTMYQGMLNARGEITFTKVNTGTKNYDDKYFGSYKSHQDGTTNYDTKEDKRANVFNNWIFKIAFPVFGIVLCFAIYYLYSFFTGSGAPEQQAKSDDKPKVENTTDAAGSSLAKQPKKLEPVTPVTKLRADDEAVFVVENNNAYTPQVVYKDERMGILFDALVVWTDSNNRRIDQMYLSEFRELGFSIKNRTYGFVAIKENEKLSFRFRPSYDLFATIPQDTQNQLAN